ncbi:MAG: nucleotide sugar dehydrogenase [Candidatus Aenigmarchaeota archaeon]|nr:nucleotide sugar dehydrogenase [Candidatus Aenigmarchaeota archaeon]
MNILSIDRKDVPTLIKNGKIAMCVVGGGYVGLPFAALYADLGAKVFVCNRDQKKVDTTNAGKTYIYEFGLDELVKNAVTKGNLTATTDVEGAVAKSDVIFITVGTPVKQDGFLDDSQVKDAAKRVGASMKKGSLIVLRSTVNPGTTENILLPILEESSGMSLGDFGLADAPERLQEGKALEGLRTEATVVGGDKFHEKSAEITAGVFDTLNVPVSIVSYPTTSEFSKFVWNYLLDAAISNAQIIAQISEKIGVDFMEVRTTANMDNRIRMMVAGPGSGGSCFPKDVAAMFALAKKVGIEKNSLRSVELVRVINGPVMAEHVVSLVESALEEKKIEMKNAEIGILGLAFKGETDDTRESPALKVVEILKSKCKSLSAYDPFVKSVKNSGNLKIADTWQDALGNRDCCVILTDHKEFYKIDPEKIKKLLKNNCMVDSRHIINPSVARKLFIYRGVGRGTR